MLIRSTGLAVTLVLLGSLPAQAYLDPGTGSMVITTLLGGVAGLVIAGKLFWAKIMSRFGLGKKEVEKSDGP